MLPQDQNAVGTSWQCPPDDRFFHGALRYAAIKHFDPAPSILTEELLILVLDEHSSLNRLTCTVVKH